MTEIDNKSTVAFESSAHVGDNGIEDPSDFEVYLIDEMAKAMTFGSIKYEPENWRKVDNAQDRYLAALLRHASAISRGETHDPETGLHHAAHAMCCASFLVELQK